MEFNFGNVRASYFIAHLIEFENQTAKLLTLSTINFLD